MTKVHVSYMFDGSVARIVLDDGKGNVLDKLMVDDLLEFLTAAKANNNLKLITFEGAGKHFSFGASVEEHRKDQAAGMLQGFHKIFYELIDLAIPTVAIVSGQCLGGGLELALMCNLLIADATARLGQPEIILGVFPPPASLLLAEKIGSVRAEELLISGRTITAVEAQHLGMLNHVAETRQELDDWLSQWITTHIVPKSASSLRFATRAARTKVNTLLTTYLPELEKTYVHQLMETHDANEGIQAFLDKRTPQWTNN
ncbi:MAG: cyclohexa-1,5-dienecarbonyl-CoA hydratase [Chlorobi bacterium]|nr:MAG: cyclohexa-1,5-dienecarbonyl-CoA hydratase [Bacteroidota bacterium]KXK35970.1 MAG: enoyl-CoA hydratase/isomerase family protein [Chlorobi bacterium OLB6]MBE2265976.1 enoyl-CoA hydratase/isomerase family protein [Flavobacteriales bacterium]MBL1161418.1 cyclohexa-1,5-dienecarbonyl-CoA hydratase [Chlorobiota bacterium]MBW7854025.1 enoyl-CoA hydratase/isomerase family protein [Candidatus Kapabacteria bacterium]MCC6331910.1 enoyl-CoA hydratase/isomerase family protein [Ignavibacteria bacteri